MAIRLASNCVNCKNLAEDSLCSQHNIEVSEKHTCDSFTMKEALKSDVNCGTCSRFNRPSCAHPAKASAEMTCAKWAPQAMA
jgi:hypothetical protein